MDDASPLGSFQGDFFYNASKFKNNASIFEN